MPVPHDATQSGVSTADQPTEKSENQNPAPPQEGGEGETPAGERELTPRELAMNSIVVKRESDDEQQATAPAAASNPAPAEPDQVEQQLAEDAPQVLSTGLDKVLVPIKIDGVEQQVSVAEMQRQFQKNGAADKRLAEATRLLTEARERAAPPVVVETATSKANSSTAADPIGEAEEMAKDIVSALMEGDETKAAEMLKKAGIGRPEVSTQIDVGQLTAQLVPAIRQQLVVDSALEKFETEYADIAADPYLDQIAARFIEQDMKDGKSYLEALGEAGKKTRDWLASKGVKTAPEPTPTTTRDSKLERKARIDEVQAVNKTALTTQEPPLTTSQVIEDMKKARGLPT